MSRPLLLCTDLDRTLLPNGEAPESPQARPLFRALAARPEVSLAYVSGRDKDLVLAAMKDYDLPRPDWVAGDVGTSLYALDETGTWTSDEAWARSIGGDWAGAETLKALFADLSQLTPQEEAKQGALKLSYYASHDLDAEALTAEMSARLERAGARAELIWSVDETTNTGLMDVIPRNATKKHAVEHLMKRLGPGVDTVFAGDSGNDLPVLVSPAPSVLVANATPEVRDRAVALAGENDVTESLYLAKGGFLGMNGNYAAGILEGVAHFRPDAVSWMEQTL